MRRRQNVDVLTGPRGLRAACGRTDEPFSHRVGADRGRQRARHRPDGAVERQFPDGRVARDRVGRDRLHGDHHGEHDRQVELAAFLGQVGGSEVHRHVPVGHAEADGVQGVAHALAAFGDRLIGQPDDDERGLPRRDATCTSTGRASIPTNASVEICPYIVPLAARKMQGNVNLRAATRKNIRGTIAWEKAV